VLQPTWGKHGIEFIMQPEMDYKSGFCNYDCVRCSEICPTGAIRPIAVEKKKPTRIGTAKLTKNQCIVYADHTDCGACDEHCPTKAVHMEPWKYGLRVPKINEDTCIGCGACEYACPTEPRAIFIVRSEVHDMAEEPVFEEFDREVDEEEDFPF
jgi:ferredoxin